MSESLKSIIKYGFSGSALVTNNQDNILLNISFATEESRRNDPDVNSPAPGTGQHFKNTEAVY